MANAVAYLHTAFSRPIIHRDINSSKFKLDENNVAKLIVDLYQLGITASAGIGGYAVVLVRICCVR